MWLETVPALTIVHTLEVIVDLLRQCFSALSMYLPILNHVIVTQKYHTECIFN